MNRLNYFNPYQTKDGSHEDQLTRAYLVLLRHSAHAFFTFFDYCKSKQAIANDEEPLSLINYLENGWHIETQKGNPDIDTYNIVSILITDKHIENANTEIVGSERNARYDGIITFGESLTMIIENKPRSQNVWFDQLNPSLTNLKEGICVYKNPIVLEWKVIIQHLGLVLPIPTISGYEKIMIEDFLSYVDERFPYLNPYDNLYQCKSNWELLNRRVNNILKTLVKDETIVKYHRNWGYYIETPYQSLKKIGLILHRDEKDWRLELSLYFADTQSQAKHFYSKNPSIAHLEDWITHPNFHVAYQASNLIWYESFDSSKYIDFWVNNTTQIYQQKKENVPAYLQSLKSQQVIEVSNQKEDLLREKFFNTNIPTLNICPGFGIIYRLHSSDAEEMDKNHKLIDLLREKIIEGLQVINEDGLQILK